MSISIQSSLFGTSKAGRFGNQFFQLLFFFIIYEKLNCKIRLPTWNGQIVFENHKFDTPLPVDTILNLESIYSRTEGPEFIINLLNPLINLYQNSLDITGSFQFNTETLFKYRHILEKNFVFTDIAKSIKAKFNELNKDANLISIHWREGDYNDFNNLHPFFWKSNFSSLLLEIKKLKFISGTNSKIYVASDDLKNISIFLRNEDIEFLSAEDFTKNKEDMFLWDFMSLVCSDVLVASNSSFSIAAALLNKNAKLFSRPHCPAGEYFSFLPWRTEILKNQFS